MRHYQVKFCIAAHLYPVSFNGAENASRDVDGFWSQILRLYIYRSVRRNPVNVTFCAEQATRHDPHPVDDGFSFLIAATRSFDPDPHREMYLIA